MATDRLRSVSRSWLVLAVAVNLVSITAFSSEYVIKLKQGTRSFPQALQQKVFLNAPVKDHHEAGHLLLVELGRSSKKRTAERLAEFMRHPEVDYVVENFKLKAFQLPNDPEISKQWSVSKVRAAEAWSQGVGSRSVIVAVIDTGVDFKHPDLQDNIWINKKETPGNGVDDDQNGVVDDVHGYDFQANDADPTDETSSQNPGHGTHCAGIVGAVGDNGKGITGMSQQVSIMALRFLDANGMGDLMNAVKSIDYAIKNGAQIISASWGAAVGAAQAQPITEAIGRANDAGVLFVAAASNDGKNNDQYEVYPANTPLPNMITVAASTSSDGKPSWSNFGQGKVSVSAPGEAIYSTLPKEKFGELSGTSMATPLVSGLAALMLSHRSDLKPTEVKALMQASGSKVEIETACNCRVDAASVVQRVRAQELTLVPWAATIAPESTLQFSTWGGKGPFNFSSSSDEIATIDSKGLLTAKAEGEVTVSVSDGRGKATQSHRIRIVKPTEGGEVGDCPLGDPALCQMMCAIDPSLPWCQQSGLAPAKCSRIR